MLQKVHSGICGEYLPWWKQSPDETYHSTERDASADGIDPTAYAAGRSKYLADTQRKPPDNPAPSAES
jgi:hypothetical protein